MSGDDGDLVPPRLLLNPEDLQDGVPHEEHLPSEHHELTSLDIVFMSLRCAITLVCAVLIVLTFVSLGRGVRVKSWRLYLLTAITLFAWLGLSLYQDHFDVHYVHYLLTDAQAESIYWCVRNLVNGLTLYLVVLLLSHMSDFQHHGLGWLGLVFAVVLVPIVYSVALLIVSLRVSHDVLRDWNMRVGIAAVRVAFYNVATTILVLVFTRR